jgi:hypothetical protein
VVVDMSAVRSDLNGVRQATSRIVALLLFWSAVNS